MLERYERAGEIAKKAKAFARPLVKPGASVLDVTKKIEERILKDGGKIAFPLNVSINDAAAHFTPNSDCKIIFGEEDLVKIDIGVHVDGYIADTAFTVSTSESEKHNKLIEAAEAGLKAGIEHAYTGATIGELGEAVEKAIKEFGVLPIQNLTGHGLGQYSLHDGLTIPNIKTDSKIKLEEGQAIAIEPFATDGHGFVKDASEVHIYEFLQPRPTRGMDTRKIMMLAENEYEGLPFAKRWLEKSVPGLRLELALKELVNQKALYQYPVLKEGGGGLVAQAEHSVIVGKKAKVYT